MQLARGGAICVREGIKSSGPLCQWKWKYTQNFDVRREMVRVLKCQVEGGLSRMTSFTYRIENSRLLSLMIDEL